MPRIPSPPVATPTIDRSRATSTLACAIAIVAAVLLAWAGALTAPFLLDDHPSVVANTSIRDLGTLDWLNPPATAGETVSGRPVLNFTFAVNHAIGGLDVEGYHVANVLIHMLAALALFGVVRRTIGAPGVFPSSVGASLADARGRRQAAPLQESTRRHDTPALLFGAVVALLWALHPLHTGAVTYIVQRAESLAGLLILLTLYCFIRGAGWVSDPPPPETRQVEDLPYLPRVSRPWFAAAFASCLLAVGTKETAAVVPIVVLLYDRAFLSGSFKAAFRARWRVHAALAATWIPLAVLVLANRGRGGSAGFGTDVVWWKYALTQCDAIVHYLRLAVWPHPLVFDHGTPLVGSLSEVWWQASILLFLLFAALWAAIRKPLRGFLPACFFLLLAPGSSFVPVATQTVAEHRMYLPLAAFVVLVVMGVLRGMQTIQMPRLAVGALTVVVAIALGAATFARNQVFRSELSLWEDTVAKRPDNPRARNNLGMALAAAGRNEAAVAEFEQAIALQPGHAFAHFNLAVLRATREEWESAAAHFRAAIAADPGYTSAHVNLGDVLARLGRTDEAVAHYRAAIALDPAAHDARTNLAALLVGEGRAAEGVAMLRSVVAEAPGLARAHLQLGLVLEQSGGSAAEAETAYRAAIRLDPGMAAAHLALGNLFAARGDLPGAERSCREAVRLDARSAEARFAMGNVFAATERFDAAMSEYRAALAIDPAHAGALNNLGNCQLVTRRFREAATTYEQVLRMRPDDETVKENLRLARELERTGGL